MAEKCEDEIFGDWVYCRQHLRPHETGWCTVSNDDKLGLGIEGKTIDSQRKAYAKCRRMELPIYGESDGKRT